MVSPTIEIDNSASAEPYLVVEPYTEFSEMRPWQHFDEPMFPVTFDP
jgi:hypothetical protein